MGEPILPYEKKTSRRSVTLLFSLISIAVILLALLSRGWVNRWWNSANADRIGQSVLKIYNENLQAANALEDESPRKTQLLLAAIEPLRTARLHLSLDIPQFPSDAEAQLRRLLTNKHPLSVKEADFVQYYDATFPPTPVRVLTNAELKESIEQGN